MVFFWQLIVLGRLFRSGAAVYSIDGRRVKEAANGLFIFRQGNKAQKVLVK